MTPRRRLHRFTFTVAGVYNVAWGWWTAMHPAWLFEMTGMPPPRYPEIFAELGVFIGLYGILYLGVARRPEDGRLVAAVGLAGKTLGPAGWLLLIAAGHWPLGTIAMIATNDLVWWGPFALYLWDTRPGARCSHPRPADAAG